MCSLRHIDDCGVRIVKPLGSVRLVYQNSPPLLAIWRIHVTSSSLTERLLDLVKHSVTLREGTQEVVPAACHCIQQDLCAEV